MITESILHSVSISNDNRMFLDMKLFKVEFLPLEPSEPQGVTHGKSNIIWRGLFVALEIPKVHSDWKLPNQSN